MIYNFLETLGCLFLGKKFVGLESVLVLKFKRFSFNKKFLSSPFFNLLHIVLLADLVNGVLMWFLLPGL